MIRLKDQSGRELKLKSPAKRIVSLVPSLTELAADLAGKESIVGLTVWCVHPAGLKAEKTIIGGTKDLKLDVVRSLKPDLILANREENVAEQVEALMADFPVYLSEVKNLDHCLEMIGDLGQLLGAEDKALQYVASAERLRKQLKPKNGKFLYFIWKEPFMVASSDTYISSLLEEIGLKNAAPQGKGRYPEMSLSDIETSEADLILLSSEPYAFKAADSLDFYLMSKRVKIVDGALFSWYGSRILKSLKYLEKFLLH